MNRGKGFSLIELMVAMAVLMVVVATTLAALNNALHTMEAVTDVADMQDNLRSSMNLMVRDLVQSGSGIPIGGIPVPFPAAPINRPSPPATAYTFPAQSTITAITPGYLLGPVSLGNLTDMITVIYADNELPWPTMAPINNPANPTCAGVIAASGVAITFDTATAGCATLVSGNVSVQSGDLIMLTNSQGSTIQQVTSVAGSTLNFAGGDAFGLNGVVAAGGTIKQIQSPAGSGVYPPTTAIRIWMITYYLDVTTIPGRPQLIRRVNFNAPQVVGQVIENMQIAYDVLNAVATAPPNNARNIIAPDSPSQIRKVNLLLAARSETPFSVTRQFFRTNLVTQVGLRSLSFQNRYN